MRRSWMMAVLVGLGLLATVGCISFGASEELGPEEHLVAGREANARGDWSAAIEEYTRAIELEPTARGYVGRTYSHGGRGEVDAAIADLTEAISLDDEVAAAFNQRALYYNQQERWAEAVTDLDRAIELRPERGDQYNGRALAHLNLGNFALAAEDATKAIELDPDSPGTAVYFGNRAGAYRELGEFELALADFEQSVLRDPNNMTSQSAQALLLVEMGDIEEALSRLEAALAVVDDQVAIFLIRAEVLWRAGRLEEAIKEIAGALLQDSSNGPLWATSAFLYAELGDLDQAKRYREQALKLSDDPLFRGMVEADLTRLEGAGGD